MQKRKGKNDLIKIPNHLAVIMDGNGRWAKKRFLPRKAGHRAGAEKLKKFVEWCVDFKIKHLTVYAFSTENWQRPSDEVNALMNLIGEFFKKHRKELAEEGVGLRFIGNLSDLPEESLAVVQEIAEESKDRDRIILHIALSYGGRQEIVRAAQLFAQDVIYDKTLLNDLNIENFSTYLYTKDTPDPDLLIRPGGEQRISNFLLWQLSYTEIYFTDTLWPDFTKDDLKKALIEFADRERRYGKVKN